MITSPRVELVVGTYARLGGGGLIPLAFDRASDEWAVGNPVSGIRDASHGIYSQRFGLYFFVEENKEGRVSCHSPSGEHWHQLATSSTEGAAPCHCALDFEERGLAIANYESGAVTLYQLDPICGLPLQPPATHQLEGYGVDPKRQAGPHAHWVGFSPDRQHLYCVDLGADRIVAFSLSDADSSLKPPVVAYRAPPGTGPRHLAFHPVRPFAFLVSELASTLTVLEIEADGRFSEQGIVSTLPGGASESLGGAIAINRAGDRLYVSNRGHESIAVFAVDGTPQALGIRVRLLQHVPSGGASPRFILLLEDEARLLVANEEGGTIGVFTIAPNGGLSPDPLILELAGAVFLAEARYT